MVTMGVWVISHDPPQVCKMKDKEPDEGIAPSRRTFMRGTGAAGLLGGIGTEKVGADEISDREQQEKNQEKQLPKQVADTVVRNAKIVTMDNPNVENAGCGTLGDPGTIAEAMAIKGDKILAVGDEGTIKRFRGSDTEVIDLGGKTVLPGFVETHVHPISIGVDNPMPGIHVGLKVAESPDATLSKLEPILNETVIPNLQQDPREDHNHTEWVIVALFPNPEAGVPDQGDIAAWVRAKEEVEERFHQEDITELASDFPLSLSTFKGKAEEPGQVFRETPEGDRVEV